MVFWHKKGGGQSECAIWHKKNGFFIEGFPYNNMKNNKISSLVPSSDKKGSKSSIGTTETPGPPLDSFIVPISFQTNKLFPLFNHRTLF